jgi:Glucose / Sorbosone dehydrogenase
MFTVIKRGIPPTMMAGWEGRVSDTEIWSIVNYVRALTANPSLTVAPTTAADPTGRPALDVADYVQMPITADNSADNTRAQLNGKILRIVPDLREHTATSTVSENERYRIPNDNPFVAVEGARKEIWASGLRNPHRMVWHVDPARPREPRLLAFNIGLAAWETVLIIKKGANYGYPLREGPQAMTAGGMAAAPADDTIPVQITDTITRGTVKPTYPVIAYPHTNSGGDAIANGFVYRGSRIPALRGKLLFGDITTGRIWYAEWADVLRADDGNPATLAPIHEVDAGLRRLAEETFRARGGRGEMLPGAAAVSGKGRVDVRFAEDNAGELYLLTKSDGMIRQVVGIRRMK